MMIHDQAQSLLYAVYDFEHRGQTADMTDIAASSGIPEAKASGVAKWLSARDYLDVTSAWQGDILRIRTTPKGQNIIELGRHIRDAEGATQQPSAPTFTYNMSGGTLNQQVGDHNQQQVNLGVSPDDIASLIAALKEGGREDLAAEVATATDNGREPGKVGKALATVIPALTAAGELAGAAQIIAGFF